MVCLNGAGPPIAEAVDNSSMPILALRKSLIAALACGLAIVVSVVLALAIRSSVSGPPFRLIIEPEDDHARVHFLQPGTGQVSKTFPISLRLDDRREVVLDSATVAIPSGRIEFADTTILPGRFKLRFGDTLFDVMQRGINVDGQLSEWTKFKPRGAP